MTTEPRQLSLELTPNRTEFEPGEILRGSISWNCEYTPRTIELRLGWYIQNKSIRDVMCHCSATYPTTTNVGRQSFEIVMPVGPLSYQGELFSLAWLLEAQTKGGKHVTQLPLALNVRR